jgi:hypothetical protein
VKSEHKAGINTLKIAREALELIAPFPATRADEMSAIRMRKIARDALAAIAAAESAPQSSPTSSQFTECRHCGFEVRLNKPPCDAPQAAVPAIDLAALDAAFAEEILAVSEVEYNSNMICRSFYRMLRKRLAATAPAMPDTKENQPVVKESLTTEAQPMQECRHCGFLCAVNPNEKKNWYPLEKSAQPINLPAAKK